MNYSIKSKELRVSGYSPLAIFVNRADAIMYCRSWRYENQKGKAQSVKDMSGWYVVWVKE